MGLFNAIPSSILFALMLLLFGVRTFFIVKHIILAVRGRYMTDLASHIVFLQVKIPRKNSDSDQRTDTIGSMKQNIEVMHQIYKNFYGLFEETRQRRFLGQKYAVLEMITDKEMITFLVGIPNDFLDTCEKTISSFYPGSVVEAVDSPFFMEAGKYVAGGYISLTKDDAYPLKTYEKFEADPMDSILSSFARVTKDEKVGFQITLTPLNEERQGKLRKKAKKITSSRTSRRQWFLQIFQSKKDDESSSSEDKSGYSSGQISDINNKAEDEGFGIMIRVLSTSPQYTRAKKLIDDVVYSLNQYNYISMNSLSYTPAQDITTFCKDFVTRKNNPPRSRKQYLFKTSHVFNIKELSSLYHFPHSRFNKNPRIKRQNFKIVPAPDNLGDEGISLGTNLYGGVKKDIKLKSVDRMRHCYIIGQTGTGKSTMLLVQAKQDLIQNNGFTLIDPHGDLCEFILQHFPKDRIDDLIYFDAGDTSMPIGMNILEAHTEEEKELVVSDLVDMFVQMYGPEIFGPRIQDYFRNGVLTLMAQPDGGTLVEIVRLFVDETFQKIKIKNVKDPMLRGRWEKTFANMGQREKQEIIPYFQSKFGPLTTTPLMRNIIGQVDSSFDMYKAMQEKKVMLLNLSKGKMGEVNSKLLGTMMVTRLKAASLRRAQIPEDERVPGFLYIDEFQNYVTPSIETILSEARKYRLGLIIAHQYIDQLEQKSIGGATDLKGPIFGNVGTKMIYKVGARDAEYLAKEVSPEFTQDDLIAMDRFRGVIQLSVDTQPSRPFSINVANPYTNPLNSPDKVKIIKEISRLTRGRPKKLVEEEIGFRVMA